MVPEATKMLETPELLSQYRLYEVIAPFPVYVPVSKLHESVISVSVFSTT